MTNLFDTRNRIYTLMDYNEYYRLSTSLPPIKELIKGIPSSTMLNYLSGFNVKLYLNENTEHSGKIQFTLVDSLLGKCDKQDRKQWKHAITRLSKKGHAPTMFWNYSNLLFYNIIFSNHNESPCRDLNKAEAKRFFDAYLLVNAQANARLQVDEQVIKKADFEGKIETVTLPLFLYQRDYKSSTDFSNQVARGSALFEYLESSDKFASHVTAYYKSINISGYKKMFRNLMVLVKEVGLEKSLNERKQLAMLEPYQINKEIDLDYINTLVINDEIPEFLNDESFSSFRKKFLYQVAPKTFFILDINFLLDHFYKAQVFAFSAFLKATGVKTNFLGDKGKDFTEFYVSKVLDRCFPNYFRCYGDDCKNSSDNELCDAYVRDEHKIMLMELKDVTLRADIKNSSDPETIINELQKKFRKDAKNPKGITQLLNAVRDLDKNSVSFDEFVEENLNSLEIYPVIAYTDQSFGIDGLNKMFNSIFEDELKKVAIKNIRVHPVVFINISYFEVHEDYLASKKIKLFDLIDNYFKHIQEQNYEITPFEVYSRFFLNSYVKKENKNTKHFSKILGEILNS